MNKARCEECRGTFDRKRPWQRFCCKKCHDDWWKKVRKEAMDMYRGTSEEKPASIAAVSGRGKR